MLRAIMGKVRRVRIESASRWRSTPPIRGNFIDAATARRDMIVCPSAAEPPVGQSSERLAKVVIPAGAR